MSKLTVNLLYPEWFHSIVADPISKTPLVLQSTHYLSANGFEYTIKDNVPDFRIQINQFESEWKKGQDVFEVYMANYLRNGENKDSFYPDEQKRDAPMYEKLPLTGRVLDVGGSLGNIRKYMQPAQEYCSIDPFIQLPPMAANRPNYFKYYPLHLPLCFVAGFAELLPFTPASYDTVNMRSCIDHFFNPRLALLEAHRVLRKGGKLIIGMTVKVNSSKNLAKETARKVLNIFTDRYLDLHIWHPSKKELTDLCRECGFELQDEIWQDENVWYASFKKTGNTVKIT